MCSKYVVYKIFTEEVLAYFTFNYLVFFLGLSMVLAIIVLICIICFSFNVAKLLKVVHDISILEQIVKYEIFLKILQSNHAIYTMVQGQ